jgi:hypothetical protein
MITVTAQGDRRFRILDRRGRAVGWIHGNAVGFRGWTRDSDASAAAAEAWEPLEATLRRHYFGRPLRLAPEGPLRLVHDGAYEWVSDGRTPIARLHRRERSEGDRREELALEFVLPSYATEGVVHAAAQVLARALGHFGGAATRVPRDDEPTPPMPPTAA